MHRVMYFKSRVKSNNPFVICFQLLELRSLNTTLKAQRKLIYIPNAEYGINQFFEILYICKYVLDAKITIHTVFSV